MLLIILNIPAAEDIIDVYSVKISQVKISFLLFPREFGLLAVPCIIYTGKLDAKTGSCNAAGDGGVYLEWLPFGVVPLTEFNPAYAIKVTVGSGSVIGGADGHGPGKHTGTAIGCCL